MTAVDKASVANVNKLVASCEDIFGSERDAWMSTSMAVARLHQENDPVEQAKAEA